MKFSDGNDNVDFDDGNGRGREPVIKVLMNN